MYGIFSGRRYRAELLAAMLISGRCHQDLVEGHSNAFHPQRARPSIGEMSLLPVPATASCRNRQDRLQLHFAALVADSPLLPLLITLTQPYDNVQLSVAAPSTGSSEVPLR